MICERIRRTKNKRRQKQLMGPSREHLALMEEVGRRKLVKGGTVVFFSRTEPLFVHEGDKNKSKPIFVE